MSPSSRRLTKKHWPFGRRQRRRLRAYRDAAVDKSYEDERISEVLAALDRFWYATDYGESRDVSLYSDEQMKRFLGEWIHVRKAGNEIFEKIRKAHPELPGLDPFGREISVEQRLKDADQTSEPPPV